MGVADPLFELHPSNLLRNHIFYCCKSTEILIRKFQVVVDLTKSVWSVLSISLDVLDLVIYFFILRLTVWELFLEIHTQTDPSLEIVF